MKIFVSGGMGFVGRHLIVRLLAEGHEVIATGSRPSQQTITHAAFRYISADTTKEGAWQNKLADIDAVINLAGRPVFKFWTKGYKQSIYDSRILTTRNLVNALPQGREIVLISTSAAGYYGDRGDDRLPETEPPGDDFLARVCRDWEKEARLAEKKGARVVIARFGVVLGKNGGALAQMIPPFKFFLGGPLGNGRQWFPWITLDDLVSALIFLINTKNCTGPYNFCAPEAVRYRDFAKTLARALKRPAFMPAPAFILRMVLREFGASILCSQRAVPIELQKQGFKFQYPEITKALRSIIG